MGAGGDTAGRDTDGGAGAVGSDEYDNVVSDGIDISAEEFQRICDDRGGWMYVTAVCAGAGMCKGLSLLGTKLTDHSCRGLNGCGGAGCVDLPEDMGLSGQQIYAEGPCGGCHGDWSDAEHPKLDVYTVVHGPDVDSEVALKRFRESSKRRLMSVVVFGTRGVHADGTPFSNMPAYYQDYSRAEIERAVEYVQRLPVRTQPYEVFGTTPGFGVPEMTNPAPGSPPAAGGTGGAAP